MTTQPSKPLMTEKEANGIKAGVVALGISIVALTGIVLAKVFNDATDDKAPAQTEVAAPKTSAAATYSNNR